MLIAAFASVVWTASTAAGALCLMLAALAWLFGARPSWELR